MNLWKGMILGIMAVLLSATSSQAQDKAFVAGEREPFFYNTPEALERAIKDLMATYGEKYPKGKIFLDRLAALKAATPVDAKALADLRSEALLANPILDFDRLLMVRRKPNEEVAKAYNLMGIEIGMPSNWQVQSACARKGYDNAIMVLSSVGPQGKLTTFYAPPGDEFVGYLDLHWQADRLMFTSLDGKGKLQVFEVNAEGKNLRQVTPDIVGYETFDACYLPNGNIMFVSNAAGYGVPCVEGNVDVGNIYLLSRDGKVRRLTNDQVQNWSPTVIHDGRVLFTRWEYSDVDHTFARPLIAMNPDGSNQRSFLFSNSIWPTGTFFARPIPGKPGMVSAIVSGHHGMRMVGELFIFDSARGDFETQPVVQRLPGFGRNVKPVVADGLTDGSWPKFIHPYPLSDKYLLVSARTAPEASWNIYLVDVFDNMVLVAHQPGYALLEPIPLRKRPMPPVIPDKVDLSRKDANLIVTDVYEGPGLDGVPRGTIKALRLYAFHFGYPHSDGGSGGCSAGMNAVGKHGPWDARRILGTVPVEEDGSASFLVPADIPIALQPLDAQGRAVQVMRSWYTAVPGERLTCVGCHEPPGYSPPPKTISATRRAPSPIAPWRGPQRPYIFDHEVQPVLDKYCVGCHDGTAGRPDLRRDDGRWKQFAGFPKSYMELLPYVRRPGPESTVHMRLPMEWHASTSELIQLLEKGHHNVKLDAEAWDRLYTWIDLNVPGRGNYAQRGSRRYQANVLTSTITEDWNVMPENDPPTVAFVKPEPLPAVSPVKAENWPFDRNEAWRRQDEVGLLKRKRLDLGDGVWLDLTLVPAGEFVMGNADGPDDERQLARVRIEKPFYLGVCEVSNRQFRKFAPRHDSGYMTLIQTDFGINGTPGPTLNGEEQPVVRISWSQAREFCAWLSKQTGQDCTLPTEAQWEYACRAGTATPLSFGSISFDFSRHANLADGGSQRLFITPPVAQHGYDDAAVSAPIGKYAPNAWGLRDMHGNVCEWTLSDYRPYPYRTDDGRDRGNAEGRKAVRGGSYRDMPHRVASSYRMAFEPWQRMYFTGFRVAVSVDADLQAVTDLRKADNPEILSQELTSQNDQRRYAAARRLGQLKTVPSPVLEQLQQMAVKDAHEDVRAAALVALESLEAGRGRQVLHSEYLKSQHAADRAAPLIASLPPAMAEQALLEGLGSEDIERRRAAVIIAGRIETGEKVRERLQAIATDARADANRDLVWAAYRAAHGKHLDLTERAVFIGRMIKARSGDQEVQQVIMRPYYGNGQIVPVEIVRAVLDSSADLAMLQRAENRDPAVFDLLQSRLADSRTAGRAICLLLAWGRQTDEILTAALRVAPEIKAEADKPVRDYLMGEVVRNGPKLLKDKTMRARAAVIAGMYLRETPKDNPHRQHEALNALMAYGPDAVSQTEIVSEFLSSPNAGVADITKKVLAAIKAGTN